jgi:hypothetical protein
MGHSGNRTMSDDDVERRFRETVERRESIKTWAWRIASVATLLLPPLLTVFIGPGRNNPGIGYFGVPAVLIAIGGIFVRIWAIESDADDEVEPGRVLMGFLAGVATIFAWGLGASFEALPMFMPSLCFALSTLLTQRRNEARSNLRTRRWRGAPQAVAAMLAASALALVTAGHVQSPRPFFFTLTATMLTAGALVLQVLSRLRAKKDDFVSLTALRGLGNTVATATFLSFVALPLLDGKGWIWPVLALVPAFLSWNVLRGKTVVIGNDAIAIRGPFGTRTVPLQSVKNISSDGSVCLTSGEHFRVSSIDRKVAGEIECALEAARRAPSLDALAQNGRTVRAWREELQRPHGDEYRTAELDRDRLREILERAASPEQRIGAALALGPSEHDVARELRIAATETANSKVASVLTKLAEGEADDDDIAEALRSAATK